MRSLIRGLLSSAVSSSDFSSLPCGYQAEVPVFIPEPKSKRFTSKRRFTRSSSAPLEPSVPTGVSALAKDASEVPASRSPISQCPPLSKAHPKPSSSSKPSRSNPQTSVDKGKAPMDGSKSSQSSMAHKKRFAEVSHSSVPPLSHFHSEAGRDYFCTRIVNRRIVF